MCECIYSEMKEKNTTYSLGRKEKVGENAVHTGMKNLAVYGMRCVLKRDCLVNLEDLEERKQNFLLILRCQ